MVSTFQLVLLGLAGILFAGGWGVALSRLWSNWPGVRGMTYSLVTAGAAVCLGLVVWHSYKREVWLPLGDNFDTLIWLAVLLSFLILYVQFVCPLPGLDWFVLPIVVLLVIAAGVFAKALPHQYIASAWKWGHLVTSYLSAVAFAVAFAVGAMYLLIHRRLRTKKAPADPNLGNLERLERLTRTSVSLGFSLLSVGMATGVVILVDKGRSSAFGRAWLTSPKIWLAVAVWLAYAVVLHAPINPSFRGRRAAILSVIGFVLMLGVIVAVQFMPEGP